MSEAPLNEPTRKTTDHGELRAYITFEIITAPTSNIRSHTLLVLARLWRDAPMRLLSGLLPFAA